MAEWIELNFKNEKQVNIMKTRRVVFIAAGFLILIVSLLAIHLSKGWKTPAASVSATPNESSIEEAFPRIAGTARVVPSVFQSIKPIEEPVIIESTNPSIRSFEPAQIVEKKLVMGSMDQWLRRRLVTVPGRYPNRLIEDTLRQNDDGAYEVVSQTAMVADHVLIRLAAEKTEADLQAFASTYGVTIVRPLKLSGYYLLKLKKSHLNAVRDALKTFLYEDSIEHVEPNYIGTLSMAPNDPEWSELWGMQQIDAPLAWDTEAGSTDILVAVVDSGVDADHVDLRANIYENPGEAGSLATNGVDDDFNGYIDDWRGWDFYNDDNNPDDDNSHGTHVAGTIGATGNNGVGVAGVCWTVSMLPVKISDPDGSIPVDVAIDGVIYATDMGALVQNHSWGWIGTASDSLEEAIKYADINGSLFVAAAGNDNNDNDETATYPSGYEVENVISVAATDESDALASFSSFGAETVDLAAPGVAILSTTPDDNYGTMQGTSMATPHVVGAAALLLSANPVLSHLDVKAALLNSVDKIPGLAGKVATGGRLNVATLMSASQDADSDGMPDSWEDENRTNSLGVVILDKNDSSDAVENPDDDHLTNLEEYRNGTDPQNPDTDGDTLWDGWEVRYGFNPLTPTGQLDVIERTGVGTGGTAYDVFVTNGYAYVAAGDRGLVIVDVTDPSSPKLAVASALSTGSGLFSREDTDGTAQGIAVQGDYAYVADGTNGLVVIDVSDPLSPDFKGKYVTAKIAKSVAVKGSYAYVVGVAGGFEVIDVSDPIHLSWAGEVNNILPDLNDIFISGDFAYIGNDNSSIYRYDISSPTSPSYSAGIPLGSQKKVLGLHGNATHLYAAVDDGMIHVINKSTMSRIALYETKVSPLNTFVRAGVLYVAEGAGGLEVVDVSDPENPAYISHHPTYGGGHAVFADGDYVYMADGANGLQVFFIAVDNDADGMLDSWEQLYFGEGNTTNTLPSADPDGDGISNWGEYLIRLIPTNSDQDADGLIDGFQEIQTYNTDPRTVDTDSDGLVDGTDGEVSTNDYVLSMGAIQFADANTNGFVDGELDYGTDPFDFDTDDDGLPDAWEVAYGLDPTSTNTPNGALDDPDGDDLTNTEEYEAGSDPHNDDTDGDGMPDGWEVDYGLNPASTNSPNGADGDPDEDGLLNIQEYSLISSSLWTGVYGSVTGAAATFSYIDVSSNTVEYIPGFTDPQSPDSDGDGLDDLWEVTISTRTNTIDGVVITNSLYITNPNDEDTDQDGLRDAWESAHSASSDPTVAAQPGDDSDGDGLPNEEEEDIGTQPDNELDPIFVDDDAVNDELPYDPEISDTNENGRIDHPFDSIGEAVAVATDGMTVLVTNGWYAFTGNYGIDPQGKAITIRSWNGRDVTFINTMGIAPAFTINSGEDTNTVIKGFSITTVLCGGSDGDCNWVNGITINNASPIIEECRIHECELNGIKITGGAYPIIRNNIIEEVLTGIYCAGGATPTIVSNQIQNNWFYHTPDSIHETGCGIYANGSAGLTIQDTQISDCWGRGIYVVGDTNLTITGTDITNCLGGVRVDGGSLTMSECMLRGNQGPNYYISGDTLVKTTHLTPLGIDDIEDTTDDDENGGGLLLMNGTTAFVENVLAVQATTWAEDPDYSDSKLVPDYGLGAGLYVGENCELISVNCTVADNLANTRGGGTSCHEDLTLRNVIAYGNRSYNTYIVEDVRWVAPLEQYHNLHCRSGYTLVWHGDIEYKYFSGENIYLFGIVITNNPGSVGGGDYHLATIDSPCIDIGSPVLAPLIDYDGLPRPFNAGMGPTTNAWHDLGAYEFSSNDYDGDGLSNSTEIGLGTDPLDPDSDDDGLSDGWEVDNTLNPLSSVGDDGASGDPDLDGLTNLEEYNASTNPQNPDTDIDGLPDGWEVDNSLDPLVDTGDDGAAGDPDGDTLLNIQEYSLVSNSLWSVVWTNVSGSSASFSFGMPGSTDPQIIDSDSDGLSDFFEITTNAAITNLYFTNPNDEDTDGDGFLDGWEIENGSDPTNSVLNPDIDGDGLTNAEEDVLGTDPANPNDPVFVDDDAPLDLFPMDPTLGDTNENGRIDHPFDAIQEAIDVATNGMTVLVTNGFYIGNGNYDLDTQGKAITVRSWNGSADTLIHSLGHGALFTLSGGEGHNTVIKGFALTTGLNACEDGDCDREQGISLSNASPTIVDCVIYECELTGIHCSDGSSPVITNCVISNVWNGVACEDASTPLIVNSYIFDTTGYGIVSENSDGLLMSDVLVSNSANRGIFVSGDTNVLFEGVEVCDSRGGVTFDNVKGRIEACQILGNEAPNYYTTNEAMVVTTSLFPAGNPDAMDTVDSDENGGGLLLLNGSDIAMENTLIASNRTWAEDPDYSDESVYPVYGLGGGIHVADGCELTAMNCTIADNHARTRGGGLSSHRSSCLRNMIFWGNTSSNATMTNLVRSVDSNTDYHSMICRIGTIDIQYSDIEYGYPTAWFGTTANPEFVGGGDYHLTSNSVGVIDTGTPYQAPILDLDGEVRPQDGDGINGVRIDMGCYEYPEPVALPSPLADADGDGMSNGDEWIAGTDWEDPDDFFSVTTTYDAAGPSTLVIWNSATQRVYTVQTTTNLLGASWTPVVPGWTNSGTGGMLIYTNTYSDTPRYFQIDVWLTTP